MLFIESPESEEELAKIGKTFANVPLVANMVEGGRTPLLDRAELERLGFKWRFFQPPGSWPQARRCAPSMVRSDPAVPAKRGPARCTLSMTSPV
jgi:2-methylisocitrate lyase-like PEP mutase family enzyme